MTDRGDDPIEWTATELAMAAARGDRTALDEIICADQGQVSE